eukprot:GHVS01059107.1.p1 GENE.GHVS01059107.1~~GHVS01059107.1.p1  ORF type:complete len:424 (-),score=5.82 GHVS01059107.1:334-1605(-)
MTASVKAPHGMTLSAIGGLTVVKGVVDLPTAVGKVNVSEKYYLIDSPGVILGMPWLQSTDATLSMASGRLTFGTSSDVLQCFRDGSFSCGDVMKIAVREPLTLQDVESIINPDLDKPTRQMYLYVFAETTRAWHKQKLGQCHVLKHVIDTGEAKPVCEPIRRYSEAACEEIERTTKALLALGAIEPSTTDWRSMPHLVTKDDGKSYRMCIDYSNLNRVTRADAYPMTGMEDLRLRLGEGDVFSTSDVESGFHNVEVAEIDRHETAFWTPLGLFQWISMPFGLRNAPATFKRVMYMVFGELEKSEVDSFVDDLMVHTVGHINHAEAWRTGAHQGVNKMTGIIRRQFWEPKLGEDVGRYTSSCITYSMIHRVPSNNGQAYEILLARFKEIYGSTTIRKSEKTFVGEMVALDVIGPISYQGQDGYI